MFIMLYGNSSFSIQRKAKHLTFLPISLSYDFKNDIFRNSLIITKEL